MKNEIEGKIFFKFEYTFSILSVILSLFQFYLRLNDHNTLNKKIFSKNKLKKNMLKDYRIDILGIEKKDKLIF